MSSDTPVQLERMLPTSTDRVGVVTRAAVAVVFAGLAVLMVVAAMTWPLDHDEHQFIVPAMLLWEGELPYRDHPHLHVPWQTLIYAAALPLHENPFLVTRLLNAAAAWATLVLLYGWGRRWLAEEIEADAARLLAVSFVVLLAFVEVVPYTVSRSWNHALSGLAMVAGVLLLIEGARRERGLWLLGAGACAGLAAGMRLSWAPMVGAMGIGLLMVGTTGWAWRRWLWRIGAFGAGFAVAMLPVAYLAGQALEAFVFGTVEYHRLSHAYHLEQGNWTGWPARLRALAALPVERPGVVLHGVLLAGLVGVGVWGRLWGRGNPRLEAVGFGGERVLWFVLVVVGFAMVGAYSPSRVNPQYHYGVLLFVALAGVTWLRPMVAGSGGPGRAWRAVGVLGAVALTVGLLGLGGYVLTLRSLPPGRWMVANAAEMRDAVAAHVGAGDVVLTHAPTFVLMAGAEVDRSLANGPFTFRVAHLMEAERRRALGVMGPMDLDARYGAAWPTAVLTGFERDGTDAALAEWASARGYEPVVVGERFGMRQVLWLRPGR